MCRPVGLVLAVCTWPHLGCAGDLPPSTQAGKRDATIPVQQPADAAADVEGALPPPPLEADAGSLPRDAARPAPPDAAPQAQYPAGPYGTKVGSVMENLSWTGYMDTAADADDDPFNEAPGKVQLDLFFRGRDPEAKVILIIESAGWCSGCVEAAKGLPGEAAKFGPKGARFVETLYEDYDEKPANAEFVKAWGGKFKLTTPTVADPEDRLGKYNSESSLPMLIYVDAQTMKIRKKVFGYEKRDVEAALTTYTQEKLILHRAARGDRTSWSGQEVIHEKSLPRSPHTRAILKKTPGA